MFKIIFNILIYFIVFIGINIGIICFSYNHLKNKYLNEEGVKKLDGFMNSLINMINSIIRFVKKLIKWWENLDKVESPILLPILGSYEDVENVFSEILKDLFESITLDTNKVLCNKYFVYYSINCIGLKKLSIIDDIEDLIRARIVYYVRHHNYQLNYVFEREQVRVIYNQVLKKIDVYIAHDFEKINNLPSLNDKNDGEYVDLFEEEWKDEE